MALNFMKFEDEKVLQRALEERFHIGTTTLEDVLLFAKENNLFCSGPLKSTPNDLPLMQKHEITVRCGTRAPTGAKKFFRWSNWKIILMNIFRLWQGLFFGTEWQMDFYFDKNTLSEMHVFMIVTAP